MIEMRTPATLVHRPASSAVVIISTVMGRKTSAMV